MNERSELGFEISFSPEYYYYCSRTYTITTSATATVPIINEEKGDDKSRPIAKLLHTS